MSLGDLVGTMRSLSEAADKAAGSVRSVAEATEQANAGITAMGERAKTLVDQMKALADNSDISLWLKPIIDGFESGKLSAAELADLISKIRAELQALAARGAGPVLGNFEEELQRLLTLIGELTGIRGGG